MSKSSIASEPECFVTSDSYTPSKSSIVTNSDILDVPSKVMQFYTCGTQSLNIRVWCLVGKLRVFLPSDVYTKMCKNTVSFVSGEQTCYIETNLPRKFSDQYNRSAPFSNSSETASRYMSTYPSETSFKIKVP